MRPIWRGAISFGLVTIGVQLYSATEQHDFRFHQVHGEDGGRIRYKRVCDECGKEVEYADIAKGYEDEDGQMVTLEKEDLDALPVNTDKAIDVVEFVPSDQVDPMYYGKNYYLAPDKTARKPYVLLRDALVESGRLAVVKITIRQRETIALLRAREDVLVLHTMLWPDEIRRPEFELLEDAPEIRPQELAMANSLIENMAGDFTPEEFTDDYREAVRALLDAKSKGKKPPAKKAEKSEGDVIDLMTALERSVESAKSGKKKETPAKKKSKRSA
jgi:DNA end-binding protein Ku